MNAKSIELADVTVARTKIPDTMVIGGELGKGTNNKVYKCTYMGKRCVLRAPRRRSDTQQRGSAIWELRHTLRASELKVGPTVLVAWYARHATREWPSGLYIIMERYDDDLETILCERADTRDVTIENRERIGAAIVSCLSTLASERIFVYDLKPSNIVLRTVADDDVDVRIIDFGRDFCEWPGCLTDPSSNTPHVDMLSRRVDDPTGKQLEHVLFSTMMVVLSATTTTSLYQTRERHRMNATARAAIHPIAPLVQRLLGGMQGRNIALVRSVLRMDEVRGVLRHYHTRRNSGTHITFAYARGTETMCA